MPEQKKNQFENIADLDSQVYTKASDKAKYLPQKVEGYLDVMEKHWGEPDLKKVNTELAQVVGSSEHPQGLTAAVYTGTNITNKLKD